jgi:hypothetical protein
MDGKWVPLSKGKILFQQEGSEVFYRNIEIKPLTDKRPSSQAGSSCSLRAFMG